MANAPTFQSPILFPREILAFKILQYSRTCVVRIATDSICFEKRLRNVSFVSLYGLSEKRKNYAPIYSRYNPANNVPNSRTVGINLEDARKRRDLVDSIVFFHGLFLFSPPRGNGLERILRCASSFVPSFLRAMILNICTSNDKSLYVAAHLRNMEIYIYTLIVFYIACDFSKLRYVDRPFFPPPLYRRCKTI